MGFLNPALSNGVMNFAKNARVIQKDYDIMEAMLKLKKENEELRKENLFLKKAAAFFAKEID